MLSNAFVTRIALKTELIESFESYPLSLPVIRNLDHIELHPKVTFFVGESGSGKSTLLEALAVSLGMNAEGGGRNFGFSSRTSHSPLHKFLRVSKGLKRPRTDFFLRAESFYNVATQVENLGVGEAYGARSLHEQSHGESFMALLNNRFGDQGLYVLDEPEAALSPKRQLDALSRIHDLVLERSQFIIATHSPILMAYPNAWIYACTAEGLRRVSYEETEHYRVMRDFLQDPGAATKALLNRVTFG